MNRRNALKTAVAALVGWLLPRKRDRVIQCRANGILDSKRGLITVRFLEVGTGISWGFLIIAPLAGVNMWLVTHLDAKQELMSVQDVSAKKLGDIPEYMLLRSKTKMRIAIREYKSCLWHSVE